MRDLILNNIELFKYAKVEYTIDDVDIDKLDDIRAEWTHIKHEANVFIFSKANSKFIARYNITTLTLYVVDAPEFENALLYDSSEFLNELDEMVALMESLSFREQLQTHQVRPAMYREFKKAAKLMADIQKEIHKGIEDES